jgi:predicted glycosyltransferase
MKTVLVYVNSQFGIGHFQRCFCILRSLEERHPDVNTLLVFGGLPHADFDELSKTTKVRLPGLTFHQSEDKIGYVPRPVDARHTLQEVLCERRDLISAAIKNVHVQVVLLEYFPFSKQSLATEVEHLLAEMKAPNPPTVVSSIRDFMTIDAGFDRAFAEDFISKRCSHVFVHADPRFATLQDTYGDVSAFERRIRYTGYVADPRLAQAALPAQTRTIVVSVGGGKDGGPLFDIFVQALRLTNPRVLHGCEILVFPGLFLPAESTRVLRESVADLKHLYNIRLCEFSEYRTAVSSSSLSVSMCGYNTAMELIAIRVPNICFVPRQRTEQLVRAKMLNRLGLAEVAESAQHLSAVFSRLGEPSIQRRSTFGQIDLHGAARSADLLGALARGQDV